MGKRGPHRQPAEIERLHGNPSKGKITSVDFESDETAVEIKRGNDDKDERNGSNAKDVKPPAHLDKVAKKEWKRLAPKLQSKKLVTEADIAAFGAYCSAYSAWVTAEKALQVRLSENGNEITFETSKGYIMQIPEVGIANSARKHVVELAREFGLTPSARNGLAVIESENNENSVMEFIKRKNRA